jgi:hypothetical protein
MPNLTPAQQQAQAIQKAQAANSYARQLVLQNAVEATQVLNTNNYSGGAGQVISLPARNVGFVKKFLIEVQAVISGTAGGPNHILTKLGAANFFSNITLTDLSNQQRINTAGWHLIAVQSAKYRFPYGAAITATDTPFGYGNNFQNTMKAPPIINGVVNSVNVSLIFEVPVTYSDTDLRGGIFAGVVGATFQLQMTINPNLSVAAGTDAVLAMYQSSSSALATLTSSTITVYQVYLDQLPQGQKGPILPLLDMNVGYMFQSTSVGALVANQDNQLQYANFRDFMSTTVIYDNAGVLNPGTDIAYIALQTANLVNIFKVSPNEISLWNRLRMAIDFPTGMYYIDHRAKPISTVQYGNMAMLFNLSAVTGSTSNLLVGWEALAQFNQITGAGSLYGV